MIIAGWCLMNDIKEKNDLITTAKHLKDIGVDYFRCKLWGGGTKYDRYFPGIGMQGVPVLSELNRYLISCMTEVQLEKHILACWDLDALWIGARNMQNYGLLNELKGYSGKVFIKRNPGSVIDEVKGIYDICVNVHGYKPYIIERGISTLDRRNDKRWRIDFEGLGELMDHGIEVVLDISHGCGNPKYFKACYDMAKSAGVKHFMFEVYQDVRITKTDKNQAIDIEQFKEIIK